MNKKLLFSIVGALILIGGFVFFSNREEPPEPWSDPINKSDEIQYLVFFPSEEGIYEAPTKEKTFEVIDEKVVDLINRVGTTGDGKNRQMAFSIIIPPWLVEKVYPGKIEMMIEQAFEVAKKRNVAAYFTIESHYYWPTRSDLWNFFDPNQPGYNPDNKKNVEWIDWEGTPFLAKDGASYRYLDWGVPEKLAPHMCYNSPQIESEVKRLTTKVIGPAVKKGMDNLQKSGKGYLFAGITVSSEPSLDNYAALKNSPLKAWREFIEKDGAPLVPLGYCALTNAGFSKANPPKNFSEAAAKINQEFVALWARNFASVGVPKNRMYTHVAAGADVVGSPLKDLTNAPIWVAFNDYSRPGWTTYPVGPLEDNFDVLYKQLADHGVTHWGGTESSPGGLGSKKIPPYQYLKQHFDHGATVVVMNTGARGQLAAELEKSVWSKNSIAAYQRFLRGE